MASQKSPKGRKRTSAKANAHASLADEGTWDCSVCTFKNNAEAFKCSMCDVRKGTSTRKPRINPDLVAQQQAQALTPPPTSLLAGSSGAGGTAGPSSGVKSPESVEDEDIGDEEDDDDETDLAALASLKANKRLSKEKPPKEKKKESKKPINKAKLRNVDRNSATYH